jgi:hypothetical protein
MSFTALAPTDFVVSSDSVTAPAWSTNVPTLSSFFTASGYNAYYLDVYNTGSNLSNAAIQFSIAYGHKFGSGSAPLNPMIVQNTPTRINYGQYRNLIFGDAESDFNFGAGNTSSIDLIVIAVDRNRYKESLFPGTFNLTLSYGSAATTIKLTDNSNDVSTVTYVDGGRVYNIISGSNGTSVNAAAALGAPQKVYIVCGSYGLYLPDMGAIVLNPRALALPFTRGGLNISWYSGSVNDALNTSASYNSIQLFNAMQSGSSFQLNSQETISSDYVFVRIPNAGYNYSTNPSFVSGSSGEMIYSNFINSPQTYITTVGMYNNNNELLAVAKLSKPLVKDFTKEALVRVKLDW